MSRAHDVVALLDRLRSRRWAIYTVWVAVLVVSFAAGGTTLGLLMDYESVGTKSNPNTLQVVGNWANDAGATANDDMGNTETNGTGESANETNSSNSNGQGPSQAIVGAPAVVTDRS